MGAMAERSSLASRRVAVLLAGTAACVAGYSALVVRADVWSWRSVGFVCVGLTYLVAAIVIGTRRPWNLTWRLLYVAGVLWFAQALALSQVAALAWVGLGLQNRYLVVAFHMAVAMPTGALPSTTARRVVTATYVVALLIAVIDGSTGYACAGENGVCDGPVELGDLSGWSLGMTLAGRALVAGIVVAGVALIVHHLSVSDRATRRAAAPVLIALSVSGVVVAANDNGLFPDDVAWVLGLTAAGLLPLAVLLGLALVELHRAQIAGLVVALDRGITPAELRDELARCLGDDSLVLGFPTETGFVDPTGTPINLGGPGRALTRVEHDHSLIAVLDHRPALAEERELLAATTAASRLALENARLTAMVQAQVLELEQSQRRIVEAGDVERRRIERNLHDGAQQRLLTIALDLGRLRQQVARAGHGDVESALRSVTDELEAAVDELRALARGLHPTVLTDHGLPVAVEALAQRAPLPLEVDLRLPRLPAPIETTGYFSIVEALSNTIRHAAATRVRVGARLDGDQVEITVQDDGIGGATPERGSGLRSLGDRAHAVGGTLEIVSPPSGGTTVTLRLPVARVG
jgi:signal transduction histidine kinase